MRLQDAADYSVELVDGVTVEVLAVEGVIVDVPEGEILTTVGVVRDDKLPELDTGMLSPLGVVSTGIVVSELIG